MNEDISEIKDDKEEANFLSPFFKERPELEKRVIKNNAMQIMKKDWYDDLMDTIKSNGDIEEFIIKKDEKYKSSYLEIQREIQSPNVEMYSNELSRNENILNDIKKTNNLAVFIHNDVQGLVEMYPESKQQKLKFLLEGYARSGEFSQLDIDSLTSAPKGFLDKIKEGKKIDKANEELKNFMDMCKQNNIHETIKNSPSSDVKRLFESTMSLKANLDEHNKDMNKVMSGYEEKIEKAQSALDDIEEKLAKEPSLFENMDIKDREAENALIREFVEEKRDEIENPPRLEISDYVERLEGLADEELLVFNFTVSNSRIDEGKVEKIFKEQDIKIGNATDEWLVRECEDDSDAHLKEVWSPVMTAKEAKEQMPKLVKAMDRAGVSRNLIMPMKAEELLRPTPKKEAKDPQWVEDNIKKMVIKAKFDRANKDEWHFNDEEAKKSICDFYGEKTSDTPPKGWGEKATTKEAIAKEFSADKYVFSGTSVSDDNFNLSARAGRNGTLFATPNLDYAIKYDGVSVGGGAHQQGKSATGDFYVSSLLGKIGDKSVEVGFINVYEQNEKDKFLRNFGCDDARYCSVFITKDEAINGYMNRGEIKNDAETFISPEKNPLAAKIMHISYGNEEFFIKVPKEQDEFTKYIMNQREADWRDTFKTSYKAPIVERIEKQKAELDQGLIRGKTLEQIAEEKDKKNVKLNEAPVKDVQIKDAQAKDVPANDVVMVTPDMSKENKSNNVIEEKPSNTADEKASKKVDANLILHHRGLKLEGPTPKLNLTKQNQQTISIGEMKDNLSQRG